MRLATTSHLSGLVCFVEVAIPVDEFEGKVHVIFTFGWKLAKEGQPQIRCLDSCNLCTYMGRILPYLLVSGRSGRVAFTSHASNGNFDFTWIHTLLPYLP
jgi:hypothetical protein